MKKAIVLLGALAGLMTAGAVPAQSWPNHPVKLIVPFAAGGTVDVVTRIVANRLTAVLGQQFLVENRTGAGGSAACRRANELGRPESGVDQIQLIERVGVIPARQAPA